MNARHPTCGFGPSRLRFSALFRLTALAASGVILTSSVGCSWWRSLTGQSQPEKSSRIDDTTPTTLPATTQVTSVDVAPVPPNLSTANRAVLEGALPGTSPLVYLVESNGTLRVRNIGTDEEIIRFDAKAGQIVRVDVTGVYLAGKPVIGANLAPGRYSIEIVPPMDVIRSTQKRSAPQSQ